MNSILSWIYETFFFDGQYESIFDALFNEGAYFRLFAIWFSIPLLFFFIFYFVWRNSYSKLGHWLLCTGIALAAAGIITYFYADFAIFNSDNSELINCLANDSNCEQFAKSLRWKFAILNSVLAAISSLFWSIIFKQFSKYHAHLPI